MSKNSKVGIQICIDPTKYSIWNVVKTTIWNFILPPHIRLTFAEKDENKKSDM